MTPERFDGHILGVGSTSGTRVVVGRWRGGPLGSFADVMVARADGHRLLLAPSPEVVEFVAATYTFDETRLVPVEVSGGGDAGAHWAVEAGPLRMRVQIGRRTPLGHLLRAVPGRLATAPAFTLLTDPVARVVMPGVRTRGSAGGGRREYYGARDHHVLTGFRGTWDGTDMGAMAPVSPDLGFGFGGTPRTPSLTAITTTVTVPH